ncbi:shikimate kinase [Demequina sp.]|uniref:shikimate kinase n=1 Tax=Demequina sp. TaxID=2050685 RepID=UPI003A8AD02F
MASPRIVLMGPPGSGKSSVGRALAQAWNEPFRDTDEDIAAQVGKTIAEIFVDDGEPHFRELERAAVAHALAEHHGVLSLGGGAILDSQSQELLTAYSQGGGEVVFLDVSLAAAAPRVGFNRSRPLLVGNPRQQWQVLMDARRPTYERLATLTVSTDDLSPTQVVEAIEQLEARP